MIKSFGPALLLPEGLKAFVNAFMLEGLKFQRETPGRKNLRVGFLSVSCREYSVRKYVCTYCTYRYRTVPVQNTVP